MMDPFSLEHHLVYRHHFGLDEINDLSEDEAFDLHRDEHEAGYRGHHHEDER